MWGFLVKEKMNITYYIGAGASYNSIPIIGELEKAFRIISDSCARIEFNDKKDNLAKNQFISLMNEASTESDIYGTIDTYARKLSINNDENLSKIKTALGVFFTLWQGVGNINEYLVETDLENRKLGNNGFKKVDSRYFGLLGNYLENAGNNIQLQNNIKFISWNYDAQLEMAIRKFTGERSLKNIINKFSFPNTNHSETNPSIVHLNGIAGLYHDEITPGNLHNKSEKTEKFEELLKELLFVFKTEKVSNNEFLTYAWEDNPISEKAKKYAEEIVRETDILVVIGYSFPTFNDKIDKKLLQIFSENEKKGIIYYQDPNADIEILTKRFNFKEDRIRIVTKTSQFVLPLEYTNKQQAPNKITIIKAVYGNQNYSIDVKDRMQELVNMGYIQGPVDPSTFMVKDPIYGQVKELNVTYSISNLEGTKTKSYKDGSVFLID